MRKLSKLLEICCKYHHDFTGDEAHDPFMCCAAEDAMTAGELTIEEFIFVKDLCMQHLMEVRETSVVYMFDSLRLSLSVRLDVPVEECEYLVPMIYQAWIDRLKEDGK